MLQKISFLREGTPQLTPNHLSRKIGHPSCENPNKAPEIFAGAFLRGKDNWILTKPPVQISNLKLRLMMDLEVIQAEVAAVKIQMFEFSRQNL